MIENDPRETIRRLAALAGVPLSEERVEALSQAAPFVRAGLTALASVDYGEMEPADRFRPEREAPR